jgi:hypothetical protein
MMKPVVQWRRSALWTVLSVVSLGLVSVMAGCGPKELPPPPVQGQNAGDNPDYQKMQQEMKNRPQSSVSPNARPSGQPTGSPAR